MSSENGPADGDATVPTVERVRGSGVPVRGNDVDTDQIVPARFLKVLTFEGIGEFAFFDQRFTENDEPKDHPFNERQFQGATILVVNGNFGCGSSREHAPQALARWGIDAIVGESFADIFAGNCLALGVPTVTASEPAIRSLQDWIEANPGGKIDVDVAEGSVAYGDRRIDVHVDDAQRTALVEGIWDTTALLAANAERVAETADSLPYAD